MKTTRNLLLVVLATGCHDLFDDHSRGRGRCEGDDFLTDDSCGGRDDEASRNVSLVMLADDGEGGPATASFDANGAPFFLDDAWANVERVELYLPFGVTCDDVTVTAPVRCVRDKLRIDGPFVVDLTTGEATPSLDGITLPSYAYRRVDVRFDEARHLPATDPLADHSLLIVGTDADGEPAWFRLDLGEEARFESPTGISVVDGGEALLLLDASQWLAAAPLADCIAGGEIATEDGELLLADAEGACEGIEDAIEDAIGRSGRLFDDGPHDETEHGPDHR